jgi:hypothetical protein
MNLNPSLPGTIRERDPYAVVSRAIDANTILPTIFSAVPDSLLEPAAKRPAWRGETLGTAQDELVRSLVLALGQSLNVLSAVVDGDASKQARGSSAPDKVREVETDAERNLRQQLRQLRERASDRQWISELLDRSSLGSQPSGYSFLSLLDSVSDEKSEADGLIPDILDEISKFSRRSHDHTKHRRSLTFPYPYPVPKVGHLLSSRAPSILLGADQVSRGMEVLIPSISDHVDRLLEPSRHSVVRPEPTSSPENAVKRRAVRTREMPDLEFLEALEECDRLDLEESVFESLLEHVNRNPASIEERYSECEDAEEYETFEEKPGSWSEEDGDALSSGLPEMPLLALVDLGAPLDDDSIALRPSVEKGSVRLSDALKRDAPEGSAAGRMAFIDLGFPLFNSRREYTHSRLLDSLFVEDDEEELNEDDLIALHGASFDRCSQWVSEYDDASSEASDHFDDDDYDLLSRANLFDSFDYAAATSDGSEDLQREQDYPETSHFPSKFGSNWKLT